MVASAAAAAATVGIVASSEPDVRKTKLSKDYEIGDELGAGAFAAVRRGRNKRTGKKVAIKVLPKTRSNAESVRREVATLQRVSMHTNIASLEAFYEDDQNFYIVMEFVSGADLLDYVSDKGVLAERQAAKLLSEMGGALALLHAQGMCHGDIKPENMMVGDDGHLKLVDFGLSCEASEGTAGKSVGTVACERRATPYTRCIRAPRLLTFAAICLHAG